MHADTCTLMHAYRQLCSVWEPGKRVYPAFPLRCQRRQPSFDSLTFQFSPPASSPRVSPPPHLPVSPFFLSLQSLCLALLFSACLEEQSHSCQSLHFVSSLRVGLSLTPRHVLWEIFFVQQSDLPVLLSPGGVAHYSTGLLISITVCLLLPPSIICTPISSALLLSALFHFLSSSICHCLSLSDTYSIYLSRVCYQCVAYTFSLLFVHSLTFWFFSFGLVFCLC